MEGGRVKCGLCELICRVWIVFFERLEDIKRYYKVEYLLCSLKII